MIILFAQVLIGNWKRTMKLLSALSLEAVHDETCLAKLIHSTAAFSLD